MSQISRVLPTALTNIAEIAPALVNLNIDFTLFKREAPKEYRGVGDTLSEVRRSDAEGGRPHVTARQLGALFTRIIPETPKLLSAYGLRASEISRSSDVNPAGSSAHGFFTSRVGADATSLWASATSSNAAIAVRLLACMLARVWDPPEAISIWVEIVEARQKEIRDCFVEGELVHEADACAAKQDISRDALRDWDASARNWLRTADAEKKRQQTQLRLIIPAISMMESESTYRSVKNAWIEALVTFESILDGAPRRISSGPVVLALHSFHLYPDIMLVQPSPRHVTQGDPLMDNAGIITIGLEPSGDQHGVVWSLPLAYLRHYGEKVVRKREVTGGERLRAEELPYVFLGCFLAKQGRLGKNISASIHWLDRLYRMFKKEGQRPLNTTSKFASKAMSLNWLNTILRASATYLDSDSMRRKEFDCLITLGRRHGADLLSHPKEVLFGLASRGQFVHLLQEEHQILYLRDIARKLLADGTETNGYPIKYRDQGNPCIIRYKHHVAGTDKDIVEFATGVPIVVTNRKRKPEPCGHETIPLLDFKNMRWLQNGAELLPHTSDERYLQRLDRLYFHKGVNNGPSEAAASLDEDSKSLNFTGFGTIDDVPHSFFHWHLRHGNEGRVQRASEQADRPQLSGIRDTIAAEFNFRRDQLVESQEIVHVRSSWVIEDFNPSDVAIFAPELGSLGPWYTLVFGSEDCGLYMAECLDFLPSIKWKAGELAAELFFDFFEHQDFSEPRLMEAIQSHLTAPGSSPHVDPFYFCLQGISAITNLMAQAPGMTVDSRIIKQNISTCKWLQTSSPFHNWNLSISDMSRTRQMLESSALDHWPMTLAQCFSCLCFLETGRFDTDPNIFQQNAEGGILREAFALCCGDSIFVALPLLFDPVHSGNGPHLEQTRFPFKRIIGNIGKSGIVALIPPVSPMMRSAQLSDFRSVAHSPFDGDLRDQFASTSLHLSFTSAELPISVGFSGAQDSEIYLLESRLSVHEGGEWVGDLDILGWLKESDKLRVLDSCCHEGNLDRDVYIEDSACSVHPITCIDNWREVTTPPETLYKIVRARKNWQARLAAAAICRSLDYHTVILPENVCWVCVEEDYWRQKGLLSTWLIG